MQQSAPIEGSQPPWIAGIGVSTPLDCGHRGLNPPGLRAAGRLPPWIAGMGAQPTWIAGEGKFTPPKTVHTPNNKHTHKSESLPLVEAANDG